MAIVLALVIVGWLVAFALGSQTGFNNDPTVVIKQSPTDKVKAEKSVTYKEPVSAS